MDKIAAPLCQLHWESCQIHVTSFVQLEHLGVRMKRARYRGRAVRQRNDEGKERGLMRKLRKSEVAGKYRRVWRFQGGGSGFGAASGVLVRDRGSTPMDMKGPVGT